MATGTERAIWRGMITRCTNPNHHAWGHYGGRGITVCKRWLKSFDAFYADMGPRPSMKYSLDRIAVNGNYTPKNCRWATCSQQQRNKRTYEQLNGHPKPVKPKTPPRPKAKLSAEFIKARSRADAIRRQVENGGMGEREALRWWRDASLTTEEAVKKIRWTKSMAFKILKARGIPAGRKPLQAAE